MERKVNLRIEPLEQRIVFDAALAATLVAPLADHPMIIYVDANATGTVHDGTSWSTAFTDLQSALNEAAQTPGPDQIWVAQGTYIPTQIYSPDGVVGGASGLNDPHLKTFDIPNNVSIYGGFKAGMTSLSQADPNLYPTILSGDLLGNDITNPQDPNYAASRADNVWHVVTIGDDITQTGVNVSLNGLTIEDGNADGPAGTPNFAPFVFNHNYGGGVYAAFGSNVILNNDKFLNDSASGDGGGVFSNSDNITVSDSSFINDTAVTRGGALEFLNTFEGSTPHVGNVINDYFQGNSDQVFGGAIVGEGTFPNPASVMNITGSTFVHNTAPEGGAIVFDSLAANISNSSFIDNVATVNGGAVATTNVVDTIAGGPNAFVTTIQNSSFIGNVSEGNPADHIALNNFAGINIGLDFARGGGALTTYINGHLIVNNDTFVGNVALSGDGGAILNGNSSADNVLGLGITGQNAATLVTGSTFIGNEALNGNGGALASETDHILPNDPSAITLTVNNSKIINNSASGSGGGIYLDTSVLSDMGNIFVANHAQLGDQLAATDAILNGNPSSSLAAYINQLATNKYILLSDNSLSLL